MLNTTIICRIKPRLMSEIEIGTSTPTISFWWNQQLIAAMLRPRTGSGQQYYWQLTHGIFTSGQHTSKILPKQYGTSDLEAAAAWALQYLESNLYDIVKKINLVTCPQCKGLGTHTSTTQYRDEFGNTLTTPVVTLCLLCHGCGAFIEPIIT